LREQLVLNKARRTRLHSIAQDRLAYQEYLETRDVLDRQITTVYTRLQKKDSVKSANLKKRKKPGSSAAQAEREEKEKEKEREMMCLAALGLGPDPTGKLVVPESLQHAVRLRRRWVDVVGKELTRKQELNPGRLYGVPSKSIYEGIDADVKMLEANMFAEQDVDG
jgi:transcriptional adapter 3